MAFKTIVVLLNDVTHTQKLLEASSAIARKDSTPEIALND